VGLKRRRRGARWHGHEPERPPPRGEQPIDRRPELLADAAKRGRLGALELVAVLVVIVAVIALLVWFFLFAHNPLLRPY
jgi:hypothetical protein